MHSVLRTALKSIKVNLFSYRTYKVSLIGGAGRIGQNLGLFLKKTPLVDNLSIYDLAHAKGVAVDLSHIERKGAVYGYEGEKELKPCLEDSDMVVISAGISRKPGMTRNNLFTINAVIVADIITAVAQTCPNALILLITNPINSLVPMSAAILEHFNVFDWRKLFGVTTLDVIRAITFISRAKNIDVYQLNVPVIGGHSETTLIPVISQCAPPVQFPREERDKMVKKIQTAGTEILEAKNGQGAATLSMAWAAFRFIDILLQAKDGREGFIGEAFVKSDDTECEFFSTPLVIGENGIIRSLGIGQLTEYELNMLKNGIPELKSDIKVGKQFAEQYINEMKIQVKS